MSQPVSRATYPGRLGLQQRVLPDYRVPFFELLAQRCAGGMSVFAGSPRADEGIHAAGGLTHGKLRRGRNFHFLRGALYLCHQAGLIEWLEEWNPESLILEANPRYLATGRAIRWMHARGRKVIGWGLGAPPLAGALSALRASRRAGFLHRFDALIAYSQRGADEYASLGLAPGRIFVAHNAVSPPPEKAPAARPEKPAPLTVLFVGRLQKRKRVDLLLRACAGMQPRPRLLIVGEGPERGALEDLRNQVFPTAEFVGERFGRRLDRYFGEADLLVLPGTGGLAVQQAMGHGLPVIVARGDGTQDDLVRAGNGWQVPPDDLDSLSRALSEALSDQARLRRMGRESYRIVADEINIERMADVFVEALDSV